MKTYQEIRGRLQDFNVEYHLYPPSEGGRKGTFQHLRCDFLYEGDNPDSDGIYMIHPEFLDSNGSPILENVLVPLDGRASMWILFPEMREKVHRHRLKVGTKGYFMEGSRKIGYVIVTEVIALHENEEEYRRLLPRTREQLMRAKRRVQMQIRMRLHQFGLFPSTCGGPAHRYL